MRSLVLTLVLALPACAQWSGTEPVLNGVGIALVAEQPGKTDAERQRQAMEASKLLAYQELAQQLYGVTISGQSQLKGGQLSNESSLVRVQGVVKGAEVLRSYQLDGRYITELRLDTRRLADLKGDDEVPISTAHGPKARTIRGY
ncbi:flagellar biosynthesis protein FlgP [Gallaecimonas kandeliae]|uniref:LPP20 family lipoprotein n=1 Tax=Gallaecimonas kandeliae TaxID=3029055 RepID=UPI0026499857|nr:flagellar biosynthesis protein FlgP [Gallaecimonas kandeliae]WKE66701.1 flagellar biosynthesis protein FlgP [Gallaecimonas kandeliae]